MSFGYPPVLFPTTMTSGQKLFRDPSIGYGGGLGKEIYYTVKDGDVGDITCWASASGRPVGVIPTSNDDVYIRHTMTHFTNTNFNTFNLFISTNASLQVTGPNRNINIFGNIQCLGLLSVAIQNCQIYLYGSDNRIDNITLDSNTTFRYVGGSIIPQPIMTNFSYTNLVIGEAGTKYLTGNLTVNTAFTIGNFVTGCIFDAGFYDITSNGTTSFGGGATCYKSGGSCLFVGLCSFGSGTWDFSRGANNIEFRGGWSTSGGSILSVNSSSVWTYTTNNQSITLQSSPTLPNTNLISGAITVTLSGSINFILSLSGTFNGNNVNSKFLMGSGSYLYFLSDASANMMTTGIFDTYTNANLVRYAYNGTGTIYQTSLSSLDVTGTGTKTLIGNTTLSANLNLAATAGSGTVQGALDLSAYNFTVTGTSTLSSVQLIKSSVSGTTLFTGLVTLSSSGNINVIDFSTNNNNIEFRGGISSSGGPLINTGTGTWSFTTNNQSITCVQGFIFNCNILISGAITLTMNESSAGIAVTLNGTLNGDNVNSKFVNRDTLGTGNQVLRFGLNSTPMSTGIIDITTNINTISFSYTGNGTIPFTSMYGYQITSSTGTKKLGGNTTLLGNLSSSGGSGILDCDVYNLTVNGTTTISNMLSAAIIKTGAGGTLTFIGLLTSTGAGGVNGIDLSTGNPNVECRGGITCGGNHKIKTGTGTWTLSTNSQSLTSATSNSTFDCALLISGAITVTVPSGSIFTLTGTLDGNNASSTFDNRGTVTYNNATKPMNTNGVLQTNAAVNTWVYGSGNQNILGGPSLVAKQVYRNLTLNGGGVKTLQGYVSVQNTYTLTAPATLNLNGFTLTNP